MVYYKTESGEVFAYESVQEYKEYAKQAMKKLTKAEVEKHLAALDTSDVLERVWRDAELRRSDIQLLIVQDGAENIGTEAEWRAYRNLLRAYPESEHFKSVRPVAPDSLT